MIAVYKRVSTDGQDLASQSHAISEWLAAKYPDSRVVEYVDQGISGKTKDRPEFQRLCQDVEAGKVQSVVVYRLDRLSRDAITALRLLLDWMQQDVEFFAVDQPILQLGKENPMRLTIVSLFSEIAQIERETLVSRVKAGLAAAKARGVKLGRPSQISQEVKQHMRQLRQQGLSYNKIAKQTGYSKWSAINAVKQEDTG